MSYPNNKWPNVLGTLAGAKLRAGTDREILDLVRRHLRDLITDLVKLQPGMGGHDAYDAAYTALTDAEAALQRLAEQQP